MTYPLRSPARRGAPSAHSLRIARLRAAGAVVDSWTFPQGGAGVVISGDASQATITGRLHMAATITGSIAGGQS